VVVDVATDAPFGSLSLLGVNPDRSFVLQLDEVRTDDTGTIRVDETVHLFDEAGNHLGSARFPLDEQFIEVAHPLALGPDANVYALLTRSDHIAVARLRYARQHSRR
jgi:hypothetical protein